MYREAYPKKNLLKEESYWWYFSDSLKKNEQCYYPIMQDNIEGLRAYSDTRISGISDLEYASMLEFSAYYGSIKCFKYILLNMENVNPSTSLKDKKSTGY